MNHLCRRKFDKTNTTKPTPIDIPKMKTTLKTEMHYHFKIRRSVNHKPYNQNQYWNKRDGDEISRPDYCVYGIYGIST